MEVWKKIVIHFLWICYKLSPLGQEVKEELSKSTRAVLASNLFIYQARESTLVPAEFMTAQAFQKLIYKAFVVMGN
jgi:hypothetical protein